MRPSRQTSPVVIGMLLGISVPVLFVIGLTVVLLQARDDRPAAVESAVPAGTAATVAVSPIGPAPTDQAAFGSPPPAPAVATADTSDTTAVATTGTAVPPVAARFHWPALLPSGMAFVPEDSWPFRVIAPEQDEEPFLVYRGGDRWLLLRNQPSVPEPIPRSASSGGFVVGDTQATMVKYIGGGFKLLLPRGSTTLQIGGQGLSDEEIRAMAASLQPLDDAALRGRLEQEAAGKPVPVTLLWPTYLPAQFTLTPAASIADIAQDPASTQSRYRIVFEGEGSRLEIGGGSQELPAIAGAEMPVSDGSIAGRLVSGGRNHLLVLPGPGDSEPLPRFPEHTSGAPLRLPTIQRGPVYLAAENLDRAAFDRIVASLISLRPDNFAGRARGQPRGELVYFWPATLPAGYIVDAAAARVSWDDYILQGGVPFYDFTAAGSTNAGVTIKAGTEVTGSTFIVPEGPGVERRTATIRGHGASAARTSSGSVVVWSEQSTQYVLLSPTLTLDDLIRVGEELQPVDRLDFLRRLQ